jgi:3-hydroxyisobutyrate dehydrogenase-like beta-hydroxyacid dehydrogenase
MIQRIGCIGLGLIGHGIAGSILRGGFEVRVLGHRRREPVEDLVGKGAEEVKTIAELVAGSDAIVLCVPSSVEVEANVFAAGGLLEQAREGLVVIDCTTALPASSERVMAALAAKGAVFVDAPVTRGPREAEEGRLNCMVGAEAATLAAVRPVLDAFCENVFHVGPAIAGHKMKLINNFITQGTAAVIAEACTAATKSGVDLERLFEVVSAGGANSSVFQRMMPWVLGRGEGGMLFKAKNAMKDVRYYTQLAETVGSTAFVGEAIHQTFLLACLQGEGENYVPAIARGLGHVNGIQVGPAAADESERR